MADTKISDLAAVTDVLATDEYVLARSGATKKIDASNLLAAVDAADVTFTPVGTISSTDVQAAIAEVATEASAGSVQLAYAEITTDVTVSSSTEASPTDVVSSGAVTYAATRLRIEFYASTVGAGATGGSYITLNLWDASTDLGRIARVGPNFAVTPCYGVRYLTPSAGSHTYRIRGWIITSNGAVTATSPSLPSFIRVSTA